MGRRLGILSISIDDKTVTVTFLVEKSVVNGIPEHCEEQVSIELSNTNSTYKLKSEWEKGWVYGNIVVECKLMTEDEVEYKLDEIDEILQKIEIEKQKSNSHGM